MRQPVYRVNPNLIKGSKKATVTLGGYGPGQPKRIVLSMKDQYIYDDQEDLEEYEIYVKSGLIRRVKESKQLSELDLSNLGMITGVQTEEAVEPQKKVKKSSIELLDGPFLPEPEQLGKSSDAPVMMTREEIMSASREDLAAHASELGVFEQVVGTGKSGYKMMEDLRKHLLNMLDEGESDESPV